MKLGASIVFITSTSTFCPRSCPMFYARNLCSKMYTISAPRFKITKGKAC